MNTPDSTLLKGPRALHASPACQIRGLYPPRSRGFAIIVALGLLSLIFLLLITLASLARVEIQMATTSQTQAEARQNALLALHVALGELQKHTGPDQRVTGTADILIPGDVDIPAGMSGAAARQALDNYWNTGRNRHWTGAWLNGNTSDFDPDSPVSGNSDPALQSWLVSGNEAGVVIDPNVAVPISANSRPTQLFEADGNSYAMLVSPSAHLTGADALARAVTAPRVEITGHANRVVGHYAWWVGDEGVKARANLIDSYANDSTSQGRLRRMASAQRMAIEAMDGMDDYYTANSPDLERVHDLNDFLLLNPDPILGGRLDEYFHDITPYSWGVLADVKHGGLKRDLSYIFGQNSASDMRAAVNASYPSTVANSSSYNSVLQAAVTPLARVPLNMPPPNFRYDEPPGMLAYTPTWEQLYSYYNMASNPGSGGVLDGAGRAVPRVHTSVNHGIHPLLTQVKLFYRLDTSGDTIKIELIPLVVLANPYTVPIAPSTYQLILNYSNNVGQSIIDLRLGNFITENANRRPELDEYPHLAASYPALGLDNQPMTIECSGIGAGQAQIYMLDGTRATNELHLVNDYDPDVRYVIDTGVSFADYALADPVPTEATLILRKFVTLQTRLYLASNIAFNDRELIQRVAGWGPSGARHEDVFLVFPTVEGVSGDHSGGGGVAMRLFDAVMPAHGTASLRSSLFYQRNYRTNIIDGHHGNTSAAHLLEWAFCYYKDGFPGNEDYLGADLLRSPGSFTQVRWGPVHSGEGSHNTAAPTSLANTDVGINNYLYDIPSRESPLASLGELQHFNTNAFIERDRWNPGSNLDRHKRATTVQSWQPNYPISNSYAHNAVLRDRIFHGMYSGYHYDGSYLWNDVLWDRFYFSSYPARGTFNFRSDELVNARYRPFRDQETVPWDDESQFRGSGDQHSVNTRKAAQNLMTEGAFNINSTSPEAWKALFASLRDVPMGGESTTGNLTAPFSRTLRPLGGATQAGTGGHGNSWNGIRNLTPTQLDAMADEMALQVKLRGPFMSMADFVNRRLIVSHEDVYGLGVRGALQAAIDAVTNRTTELVPIFRSLSILHENLVVDNDFRMSSILAGFPGYLLQADVLSAVGPYLSARSDTFRIRTYGDSVNPVTGKVQAQAWCEAIVQRVPDYVIDQANGGIEAHENPASGGVNDQLGRRYVIISMKWISVDDI